MKMIYNTPLLEEYKLTANDVMAASNESNSNTSSFNTENRYSMLGDVIASNNSTMN